MTQQINLYDPRLRRQRELLSATNLAMVSVVLLLIVGISGTWSRVAAGKQEAEAALLAPQARALQDQLLVLGQQVSTRKPDARLEQELAALKTQATTRTSMLTMLRKGLGPSAVSFAEYLRGFVRQTPNGLWMTGFAVDGDGAGMEIQGRTVDPALIAVYIKRLNGEKAFHGVAFSALQLTVPVPAVGTNVALSGTPGATAVKPPYHEFILVPALQGGTATVPFANDNDASSIARQSDITATPPPAVASALQDASKKANGVQQ